MRLLLSALSLALAAPLFATALLRNPDLHGQTVVFTYADDLWTAPVGGGNARRLTPLAARKLNAKFSPDGRWIAFTAERGGNYDVWVVAAAGGEARRLTWHPMPDFVAGWTPDSRAVLFRSRRSAFTHPVDRLFLMPREGGAASELPLTDAGPASFAPDGRRLVYTLHPPETWNPFRGYRGGKHAQLFIYDLEAHAQVAVAPSEGNDVSPAWSGGRIYFASDREGARMALYAYDVASKSLQRLTGAAVRDVRAPSAAADGTARVVYATGAELRLFDVAANRDAALRIDVEGNFAERRPHTAPAAPVTSVTSAGDRAVVTARGEVFLIDPAAKRADDLTKTSGAREVSGVASPDGRWIAYASDVSGESEIYLRSTTTGETRRLTQDGGGFRDGLRWSPDSSMLLFVDQTQTLFLLPIGGGAPRAVDRSMNQPIEYYEWSPDSAFFVYTRVGGNQFGRLMRYGIVDGRSELTRGRTDDFNPVLDPSGERIYFLSARNFRASFSDFEQTFNFNDTVGLYAAPLADAERASRLPVDPGSISHLGIAGRTLLYLVRDRRTGATALHAFDLDKNSARLFAADVSDYSVRGTTVLIQRGSKLSWQGLNDSAPSGEFDLDTLTMPLDPPAEWRQIFNEAWRLERDYFWEPTLNGVDWRAVRERYAALLPSVAAREDLNALLGMMVAELGVSHTWAFGGDMPQYSSPPVGVLGADFAVDAGRWRVAHLYRGDRTADEMPSPLFDAGVKEGELLLRVDGRELTAADNLYERLEGKPGKPVMLTVGNGRDWREVAVTPVGNDMILRYGDWVAANRARVEAATGGRAGYLHVPNTGRGGMAAFARQFFAQSDKEAIIVDVRWNAGGLFPASMIEHLQRRELARYASRWGNDIRVPTIAVDGPKLLLANAYTISGGDAFTVYFRQARLGPIVGERTAGATVGNVGMPSLIDGGEVAVPALAYRGAEAVENRGVAPDVAVAPAFDRFAADPDPQLTKAIELIRARLPERPAASPR